MENNELTTREKLKTYFETGKYPTESQFAELIDSLKFKEDVLTNKEVIILANSLASIDTGFISYLNYNTEDEKFPIVVSSRDEEDQVIIVGKSKNYEGVKQYFLGREPYIIKAKEFSAERLKETEYYYLRYQIDPSYMLYKLFGNNLPTIPDGFEFGMLEGKNFTLEINKLDYGKKINILNTSIKFINKTEVPIQYMVYGGVWSHIYTTKDIITDHYDIGDYLNFNYKADLRGIDKSIECKIYNEDNDQLLMTAHLVARQNNINVSGGGTANEIRNIRIECNYSENME